jgi:hypothetical protein
LRTGAIKAAVQNNFFKTFALPVLSCGEFASDFRDSQGYTAFCTVQLNKKVILDRRLTRIAEPRSCGSWVSSVNKQLGFQPTVELTGFQPVVVQLAYSS